MTIPDDVYGVWVRSLSCTGYVRWTEQRNFEAVLDLFSTGSLSVQDLKSEKFDLALAPKAYETLLINKAALGILLKYDFENTNVASTVSLPAAAKSVKTSSSAVLGVIGAGNHAGRTLIPTFQIADCRLKTIASSQGMTGTHYGKKFGFELNTTDKCGCGTATDKR